MQSSKHNDRWQTLTEVSEELQANQLERDLWHALDVLTSGQPAPDEFTRICTRDRVLADCDEHERDGIAEFTAKVSPAYWGDYLAMPSVFRWLGLDPDAISGAHATFEDANPLDALAAGRIANTLARVVILRELCRRLECSDWCPPPLTTSIAFRHLYAN